MQSKNGIFLETFNFAGCLISTTVLLLKDIYMKASNDFYI